MKLKFLPIALKQVKNNKQAPRGVPSIKQIWPTEKINLVGAIHGSPDQNYTKQKRAIRESPLRIKRTENLTFSVLFHTPCPARYSVLHLLGVLSGGNEPPLCKGRWLAKQDGGIVKAKAYRKTIPQPPSASAPFTQGSLWFVRPQSPSTFPDKHCLCGHKSDAPHKAGRFLFYITFILLTKLLIDQF